MGRRRRDGGCALIAAACWSEVGTALPPEDEVTAIGVAAYTLVMWSRLFAPAE
jgi:hypothetical protein